MLAEKEGFEPSRPFAEPTPLAGEPLTATWVLLQYLAEREGFEPPVPCGITGFQDQLHKPLGHLSLFATKGIIPKGILVVKLKIIQIHIQFNWIFVLQCAEVSAIICRTGMWLSRLARFAHIEEVGGSSPSIPTKIRVFLTRIFLYLKCLKVNDHKVFLKVCILT